MIRSGREVAGGLRTPGGVFDGDPPSGARGRTARAWSAAEVPRAFTAIEGTTG